MPQAAAANVRRRWRLIVGHMLQLAVALLLGALLYLGTVGFPKPWVERIVEQAGESGLALSIQRVRYVPPWGIVVRGVRVFLAPADQHPSFTAREVLVRFRLRDLLRGEWLSTRLFVQEIGVAVNLTGPLRDPDAPEVLQARIPYAALQLSSDALTVQSLRADLRGNQPLAQFLIFAGDQILNSTTTNIDVFDQRR